MHHRSSSQLQGVSGTAQDGVFIQVKGTWHQLKSINRGAARGFYPRKAAPLWAWLLMGALVVPGAWSFLSEEQEELLVELHNHYRGVVSPSASAMMPLKWDANLKLIAENYAAKCIWSHNPELEDTGENLFAGTGQLDLREAMEKWFLERLNYNYSNNSCEEDMLCGHYTQMVWADTHRVGCAFHLCNMMEGLGWEKVSFLVCNYYPAGNYEEERPYVEGEWCSSCPENLQNCENNLCVPDNEEDEDVMVGDDATEDPYSTTPVLPILPEEMSKEEEVEEEETKASPPSFSEPILILEPTSSPSIVSTTRLTAARLPTSHTDEPTDPTAAGLPAEVEQEQMSVEEEVKIEVEKVKEQEKRKEIGRDISAKEGSEAVARGINKIHSASNAAVALLAPLFLICLTAVLALEL
ncbi:uncharacterized protein ACB058_018165 [Synchiropus picturatus]